MMPNKVTLPPDAWAVLLQAASRDKVYLEGNFLKLLDPEGDEIRQAYLDKAIKADKEARERRLEVTKQVQKQNEELKEAQAEIEQSQQELEAALEAAETARKEAEGAWKEAKNDLDYMQKQTQFELMGRIVRVSLGVIIAVGTVTTSMYALALFGPKTNAADTTLLANTWSNMFGILLTNSFSIIGTIMGVKYATEGQKQG